MDKYEEDTYRDKYIGRWIYIKKDTYKKEHI